MKNIENLHDTIVTNDFLYKKYDTLPYAYIYEVTSENHIHYDIFERKVVGKMIDFEKREYSTTEFRETYPKDSDFGSWAWSTRDLNKAYEYLTKINNEVANRLSEKDIAILEQGILNSPPPNDELKDIVNEYKEKL